MITSGEISPTKLVESAEQKELYTCEICGFTGRWQETDDIHGDLWGCEVCGMTFCSKCLKEEIGYEKYREMMISGEYIRCPECFEKVEKEVQK